MYAMRFGMVNLPFESISTTRRTPSDVPRKATSRPAKVVTAPPLVSMIVPFNDAVALAARKE